jgi:hypothetical protein
MVLQRSAPLSSPIFWVLSWKILSIYLQFNSKYLKQKPHHYKSAGDVDCLNSQAVGIRG